MRRTIRLCVAGALASSVVVALPAAAGGHLETVLTGIGNPRGLTFDAAGNLYVAASGTGGDGPCISAPEGGGDSCYGDTGAIHRLLAADVGGAAEAAPAPGAAFVPSLPSHAGETGGEASGPADVAVGADGRLYFTIGLGADPAVRDGALDPATGEDLFATLQSVLLTGGDLQQEADLGDHEASDPDQAGPDTNPFGLAVDTADDLAVVADSGGNTILEVDLTDGTVATGAVLSPRFVPAPPFLEMPNGANMPSQAVPTGLSALPDGGYVTGQLTGFPFAPGAASVYTFDGEAAEELATGFTNVIDVAVGPDEALYVLELSHDGLLNADGLPMGALIRVTTDGDAVTRELLVDDLPMPGGLAFGPDEMAYITTMSATPAGEVVRFDVTGEPLVTVTDDTATTQEDMRLVAGDADDDRYTTVVADVTANDGDEVVEVTPLDVARGAVDSGSIVYQPAHHFNGEDAVPYRACTDDGHCLVGVLTITVEETATDRIAGENRIATAVTASMGAFPDGAPTVVVARADLYPDALAGGPLAQVAGGPILLTGGDALDPATAAEIRRLGPAQVYVLGGAVAIGDDVVEDIREIVPATRRVSGENRYATAVAIMQELDALREAPAANAFVVEGYDPDPNRGWPDAVSVSGLASWQGEPILLVETDRMPAETAAALDGMDATIIGGSVAIGDGTRAAIATAADDVTELRGATRYATSRAIAEASFDLGMRNPLLTLVSGGNWPDALVAGPLVADDSPTGFMLVHPTDLDQSPETVAFIREHGPFADIDLFGGRVAISDEVEAGVAAAND